MKARQVAAISEQLSLLEKETGIEEGFFIQPLGAARGSIFRQRCFVEVVGPGESFADGEFGGAKGGLLAFSVGRQLLLAAHGRERLSHKSSATGHCRAPDVCHGADSGVDRVVRWSKPAW
jgi:hypothetical protein